ncbi:MAG: tetratricopeptide repeat protein [Desulfobacterales bacterium]|nr:tetratricopeptide repeat protein [Desulfobacterales bacterium]
MKTHISATLLVLVSGLLIFSGCAATKYKNEKARKDAEAHRRLGDAYSRQGNITRALRSYLDALAIYELDPETHYSLGLAYQQKENYQKAIQHFNRAIELKPDMGPAKNSLGVSYIKIEDYDRAIEVLQRLTEDQGFDIYLTPHYPKYNLGLAYYHKRQYETARDYFRQVADYFASGIPKDRIYILNLRAFGLTYLDTGNPVEALKYFDKVAAVAPRWPDIYLDLARAHLKAGFKEMARANYRKVLELAPESALAETALEEMAAISP